MCSSLEYLCCQYDIVVHLLDSNVVNITQYSSSHCSGGEHFTSMDNIVADRLLCVQYVPVPCVCWGLFIHYLF